VTRLKNILEGDANLLAAVWAAHGTSRSGAAITHKSYLAESLADKAWASMTAADRLPWNEAAEAAKRHLDAVDWGRLDGALDKCQGFATFLSTLKALRCIARKTQEAAPPIREAHKLELEDFD
jgi:hypothetical protein